MDLSEIPLDSLRNRGELNLEWLISTYQGYPKKDGFFKSKFFDKLAGSSKLREQIIAGKSSEDIRAMWQEELDEFKPIREKYLLYP